MKAVLLIVVAALALSTIADARQLHARHHAPKGWTKKEQAAHNEPIRFIIALRQQNLDVLESELLAVSDPSSPRYQEFKTIDEILNIVAPPKSDHDAVWNWLARAGVTQMRSHGDAIEARTTVSIAEKLFSTKFFHFVNAEGRRIVRQWGAYSVPHSLSHLIDLVSGLSEFPIPHYQPKIRKLAPLDGAEGVSPNTVEAIYKTPANPTIKSGTSVGVIEFEDQYFSPDNLATFQQQFGLKNEPVNTTVGTNDPSAPGIEAELDVQYVAGVAVNAKYWFWIEADNVWLYGWATHFFGTTAVPNVVSISYGWSENDQCEDGIGGTECSQLGVDSNGYVTRVNSEFQKIGLRGVSILVASGDSGANGRTDEGCTGSTLLPDYPTASPWVTSVGATQLNNPVYKLTNPPAGCESATSGFSCATGGDEVAVSFDHASFASGGGFSNVAAMPSYQTSAVENYLTKSGAKLPPASYYNSTGRAYPDVSGFGSDVLIYSGGLQAVGGTSASSPIFAGVVALLNDYSLSKTGKPLGFLNPLLYQMQAASPSAFIDITVGDNLCTESGCSSTCQGYYCAKGWDPVTGLGSPNYVEMYDYLSKVLSRRTRN